jgi:hypothetical protein
MRCGNPYAMMNKRFMGLATTALVTGGLGLVGLGLASGPAQAEPGPFPAYHWCPGDFWDPGWGNNWDGGFCHDDFHRDMDGDNHDRDWHGDQGRDQGPWQRGDQGPQWWPGQQGWPGQR